MFEIVEGGRGGGAGGRKEKPRAGGEARKGGRKIRLCIGDRPPIRTIIGTGRKQESITKGGR